MRSLAKPPDAILAPIDSPRGEESPPQIVIVRLHPKAVMPTKGSARASCYDLYACMERPLPVHPMHVAKIPTGIAMGLPEGWEGVIRPRSGMALERVTVMNAPGTLDEDYTGEVMVLLVNLGPTAFLVKSGERIAQLKVQYCPPHVLVEGIDLPQTDRGSDGFGSTGR